ncbi:hypothetical protein DMH01_38185 [Amycolatopsis sp. WAC 04182]|uniref:hypothetical protein n=1 Tax=Amycolatopsis sp. WAC 04182 TaxID=2203198 RepID=UPI000F774DD1|nr:hypothetical protein [Amycolatopsis sp. WAC 04182]RSN53541.1 hypothetical protein DMH01_38185 [Amycolatopsis sp. WAC 04182]
MLDWLRRRRSELTVTGNDPDSTDYEGTVIVDSDGDAVRLRWIIDHGCRRETLFGVGIEQNGNLCVARSRSVDSADLSTYPGVVNYDIQTKGRLPAIWYRPDLDGELGGGLSTDGPTDRICGLYRADYGANGTEFPTLTKEITDRHGRLHIRWLQGDQVEYGGLGFVWGGHNLVAAWSQPPRDDLDVMLCSKADEGVVDVTWFGLSTEATGATETWQAR